MYVFTGYSGGIRVVFWRYSVGIWGYSGVVWGYSGYSVLLYTLFFPHKQAPTTGPNSPYIILKEERGDFNFIMASCHPDVTSCPVAS